MHRLVLVHGLNDQCIQWMCGSIKRPDLSLCCTKPYIEVPVDLTPLILITLAIFDVPPITWMAPPLSRTSLPHLSPARQGRDVLLDTSIELINSWHRRNKRSSPPSPTGPAPAKEGHATASTIDDGSGSGSGSGFFAPADLTRSSSASSGSSGLIGVAPGSFLGLMLAAR